MELLRKIRRKKLNFLFCIVNWIIHLLEKKEKDMYKTSSSNFCFKKALYQVEFSYLIVILS